MPSGSHIGWNRARPIGASVSKSLVSPDCRSASSIVHVRWRRPSNRSARTLLAAWVSPGLLCHPPRKHVRKDDPNPQLPASMDNLAVAYGVLLNRRELRDTLIDQPECSPARSVAMGGATS